MISTTFFVCLAAAALSVDQSLPNPDFDEGRTEPDGWSLSGGAGSWIDRQVLQVSGNGGDSSFWRSRDLLFQPGELYEIRFRARALSGSGTAIAGPEFANRDFPHLSADWSWQGFVFRAPDRAERSFVRLGQWRHSGTVQYDAVRLTPVRAVHGLLGALRLGDGESIEDGGYSFRATFGHRGGNYHRPLESATAGFNSDRWVFGGDSEVVYRFEVPGHRLGGGEVRFAVNHHTRGACVAEARAGADDRWRPLARREAVGDAEAKLPPDLLPAQRVFLRLRSLAPDASFQINRVEFDAEIDGAPVEAEGRTLFARLEGSIPDIEIERIDASDASPGGMTLHLTASNRGANASEVTLGGRVARSDAPAAPLPNRRVTIEAGKEIRLPVSLQSGRPGEHVVSLRLTGAGGQEARIALDYSVHDYDRTDYGRWIGAADGAARVWWCDATRKVPPRRAPPPADATSGAVELAAARNDFEAAQVVVRPSGMLEGLTASAGSLSGPGGAMIAADRIQILRVAYHRVRHPTDSTGVRGLWPDALPPLSRPIDVAAGTNQPLWVLVHVPGDAVAGAYSGTVSLRAKGWSQDVPLRLHVWNFALPRRNHIETAFGLSVGDIFRYHGARTEPDKRRVLDLYFRSFSEHRISPYDPAPLDPIRVEFRTDVRPPRVELDFTAFDAAMARAVEEFDFTGFRLPIRGMGGGTFHERYPPEIGDFGAETEEYRAMFAAYVKGLEEHLREKGWLDLAYVYWFDEPAPRDYDFVIAGMRRLHESAPGLRRMLTEEPGDELAGSVDIWCPVSDNYEHAEAEKRRAHGERIWWYVCTGPKAPYCTLFIDHPATELRVWLWQTWQRGIAGILVWRANYWTSSAAFPDRPQDPYDDPMGYVSGYSTPRGVKRFWGNGDGRFIYPPESAAVPGASGNAPVIAPPVSSIRWEMLREGIEDWEYLWLLESLLDRHADRLDATERDRLRKLLDVPESITRSMTSFTTDPAPIYARRAEIARAIERLLELDRM